MKARYKNLKFVLNFMQCGLPLKQCIRNTYNEYWFVSIFQEQYITIFLALNEIFKSPIEVSTTTDFATKAGTIITDKPANQSVLREEFQVRPSPVTLCIFEGIV